jgi:tight adherence protein B
MTTIILIVTFAAGFFLVFGMNLLLADIASQRRTEMLQKKMEERRLSQLEHTRQAARFKESYTAVAEKMQEEADKKSMKERLEQLVLQSGMNISVNGLIGASMLSGTIPALLIGFLAKTLIGGIVAFPLCFFIPLLFVKFKRKRRNSKMLKQLPDAFELMSRMLRAGQTMSQALQGVGDECTPPVGSEFLCCYEQQNLGLTLENTMHQLAERTGLLEIKVFVVAITIHQQTGGNLSELLETLSRVIRERGKIDGKIGALTAEGRMQAWILLALPILLLGALFFINRPYMLTLFDYPALIGGMFVCEFLGAVWIRKIINFDF